MGTTTDWRPLFVASAASMLRVKASKKWPGWQDAVQEDAAKAACRQAAADIEGIPALSARAEAAERELAQARADAEVLAVAAHGLDDCDWIGRLRAAGLTEAEEAALDALHDRLYDRADAEVLAVIRRALGGAA